ncbi:C-type lectin domain family 4 member F-like [Neocloeon triangulifer]|uniref:C-type lectin domain family 4 member F-like n=1 Tax=Neocloeon triangulifer TaxID=2078957 RepID=UPI00286EE2CC|nr:C-type lectin domain family 4 member F-like [Neocloeon triangulifer]
MYSLFLAVTLLGSIISTHASPTPIAENENVAAQKYLAKIHAQLADYFRTIENYFISVLTVGNQRLNKVDEKLDKILNILNQLELNNGAPSKMQRVSQESSLMIPEDIQPAALVPVQENSQPASTSTTAKAIDLKKQPEEPEYFLPEAKEVNLNYFFSQDMKNWFAAEEFCDSLNWTLASINSDAEVQLLWKLMPHNDECYWTGASDIGYEPGDYHWSASFAGEPGGRVSKGLWGVGQPNDFGKDKSTCVVICGKRLFDFSCLDSDNYFICKNAD